MARYFFRSSILWRDLILVGVGLLALVPVSIVLSDDVARWGVVKHVGYRLQTNAIENAFYRRFLELMQAEEGRVS